MLNEKHLTVLVFLILVSSVSSISRHEVSHVVDMRHYIEHHAGITIILCNGEQAWGGAHLVNAMAYMCFSG